MSLYAAQVGFYSAVPKDWKESRGARLKGAIPLPELRAGEYLLDIARELKFAVALPDGGRRALNYTDLHHYNDLTGRPLQEPWEARAVIAISEAYIGGYAHGLDEFSLSPMEVKEQEDAGSTARD